MYDIYVDPIIVLTLEVGRNSIRFYSISWISEIKSN